MTTTNKAKTKSAVRSFTKKPQFRDNPLPVLYSTRIRLTDDERQKLKTAYINATALEKPPVAPAIGGSSVQTVTSYGAAPFIDQELGMETDDCHGSPEQQRFCESSNPAENSACTWCRGYYCQEIARCI